jgi:urate oxidase
VLTENSYGKSSVRLTKVVRHGEAHELMELSADIVLTGDFSASYTDGDNSQIIATDSMKNTVYVLAKERDFKSIEEFAILLCGHFIETYRQVRGATVAIRQTPWERVVVHGKPHAHSFVEGGAERRICRAEISGGKLTLSGGVVDLGVLKTTGSEFCGFVQDRYRTLADTSDRIFATRVEAFWEYLSESADFDAACAGARTALLGTFADHHSLAVQQTLLAMGEAVLKNCPAIRKVRLIMPNQHRILANLKPFGLENRNEIFVPTSEPFGLISGVVERDSL